jgi:transcriptional regulator
LREIDNVRTNARKPFVPAERHETIRQEIIESIRGQTLSARDISVRVRIAEKEVFEHLEHIRMSMGRGELNLLSPPPDAESADSFSERGNALVSPASALYAALRL